MDLYMFFVEGEKFSVRVDEVEWLRNRIVVRELVEKLKDMVLLKKYLFVEVEVVVWVGNEFFDFEDKEVVLDEEVLLA